MKSFQELIIELAVFKCMEGMLSQEVNLLQLTYSEISLGTPRKHQHLSTVIHWVKTIATSHTYTEIILKQLLLYKLRKKLLKHENK